MSVSRIPSGSSSPPLLCVVVGSIAGGPEALKRDSVMELPSHAHALDFELFAR